MIRTGTANTNAGACWPRTSGDDPPFAISRAALLRLAPHERG